MAPVTLLLCEERERERGVSIDDYQGDNKSVHKEVALYLGADEHQPLQLVVGAVVDDLAAVEVGVALKDLGRRRVALHRPVEDGLLGDEGDRLDVDPLPEDDVLRHRVRLHHRLHLDVEDLQRARRLQCDHLRRGVHDGGVGADRPADRRLRVGHVDDHHLGGLPLLLADADELVALHGEHVEANARLVDPDLGQLKGGEIEEKLKI